MQVNRKFVTLGVLIMLVPFLGILDSWKYIVIWALGFAVIFTAIEFPRPKKKHNRRKTDRISTTETFAENDYSSKSNPDFDISRSNYYTEEVEEQDVK